MHIYIDKLHHQCFRQWLVTSSAMSYNTSSLLIGDLGTNFSEGWKNENTLILNEIKLKMPSANWRPLGLNALTHWGRVTHICVDYLTTIASDNGLWPSRCQDIIWTNAGILLIEPLRTNFNEISIEIYTFSFKEMHLKMLFGKWRSFYLGLNVLIND